MIALCVGKTMENIWKVSKSKNYMFDVCCNMTASIKISQLQIDMLMFHTPSLPAKDVE